MGTDALSFYPTLSTSTGRQWARKRKYSKGLNWAPHIELANAVGWTLRHVQPHAYGRHQKGLQYRKAYRWDVHSPSGNLVGSEPTLQAAIDVFLQEYIG